MQRLLPLLILLASPVAQAQQTVRDSVRMELTIQTGRTDYMAGNTARTACAAYVLATWPNVTTQLYAREGRYSDYSLHATEGMWIPRGFGELPDPPEGRLGHRPQLGGAVDAPTDVVDCSGPYAAAAYHLGGGTGPLNGRPFRVTEWYAVFNILDGTPLALFEWEPGDGLAINFDGSFESGLSHEVDTTAPENRRPVASYLWRFGDGESGSGARPTHTYDEPGEYTVRLVVTDDDGEESFHEETVTVHAAHLTVQIESATEEATKGDTLEVRATVTNSGSETVFGVRAERLMLGVTRIPDELTNPAGQPWALRVDPVALEPGEENHVYRASLAPGESFEVTRRYVVAQTALYRIFGETDFAPAEMYVDWLGIDTVEGETAEINQVEVRQPCTEKGARCASTLIYPPVRNVALQLRTAASENASSVTAGITYNQQAEWAGFLNVDTGLGGVPADDITCLSGCVELIATVTGRNDEPIEDAEVRFTASALIGEHVATTSPRGSFMCEKGRDNRFAGGNCAGGEGDFTITVKTAADGQARAILSLQSVFAPVSTEIRAESLFEGQVKDEAKNPLTVEPNLIFESERTLTGTDAEFVFSQRQLVVFGGTSNSIGELCENAVKKSKGIVDSQNLSAIEKNVAVYGIHLSTSYICDAFLSKASNLSVQGMMVFDWLTGEGGVGAVGDALKKVGAANLYLWTLHAYDIKNPHGLSLASGPHPPPAVVYFDGDFFEWTTEALQTLVGEVTNGVTGPIHRDLTGVRTRLRITDLSTRRQEASPGVLSTNFLRGRAELAEWINGDWTILQTGDVEYLYLPHLFVSESVSEWLDAKLGLVERDPETGALIINVLNGGEGRSATRQLPPDYVAGDIVLIGDGENAELNQVVSMEGSTVELVLPLANAHTAGDRVSLFAEGIVGPPPPPLLVTNLNPEASVDLTWSPNARTLVASYDIQIATDEAMTTLIFDEAEVTETSAPISPGAFTEGQTYYWRVRSRNRLGISDWTDVFPFTAGETVITPNEETPELLPIALSLSVYPNPATQRATLAVELPSSGAVRIALYDALGREIGIVEDRQRPAGRYELALQVSGLPPGAYVARVEASGIAAHQRFTIVR